MATHVVEGAKGGRVVADDQDARVAEAAGHVATRHGRVVVAPGEATCGERAARSFEYRAIAVRLSPTPALCRRSQVREEPLNRHSRQGAKEATR